MDERPDAAQGVCNLAWPCRSVCTLAWPALLQLVLRAHSLIPGASWSVAKARQHTPQGRICFQIVQKNILHPVLEGCAPPWAVRDALHCVVETEQELLHGSKACACSQPAALATRRLPSWRQSQCRIEYLTSVPDSSRLGGDVNERDTCARTW